MLNARRQRQRQSPLLPRQRRCRASSAHLSAPACMREGTQLRLASRRHGKVWAQVLAVPANLAMESAVFRLTRLDRADQVLGRARQNTRLPPGFLFFLCLLFLSRFACYFAGRMSDMMCCSDNRCHVIFYFRRSFERRVLCMKRSDWPAVLIDLKSVFCLCRFLVFSPFFIFFIFLCIVSSVVVCCV